MSRVRLIALSILFNMILSVDLNAQFSIEQSWHLNSEFQQIKESSNYGLVNSGANLDFGFDWSKISDQKKLHFSSEIASGGNYRYGFGVNFQIRPIDIFYGYRFNNSKSFVGPYAAINYQYQLYPELQSGHPFWYSTFELGPRVNHTIKFLNASFDLDFKFSFLSMISRPDYEIGVEQLFYTTKFTDVVSDLHSNLYFNLFIKSTHIDLKIMPSFWELEKWKIGYQFELFAIGGDLPVKSLSHSINFYKTFKK